MCPKKTWEFSDEFDVVILMISIVIPNVKKYYNFAVYNNSSMNSHVFGTPCIYREVYIHNTGLPIKDEI